jgi:hypothetical protein
MEIDGIAIPIEVEAEGPAAIAAYLAEFGHVSPPAPEAAPAPEE